MVGWFYLFALILLFVSFEVKLKPWQVQKDLAHLVLWVQCPCPCFALSFAPQECYFPVLTDHCRVPFSFKPRSFFQPALAFPWQAAGTRREMPRIIPSRSSKIKSVSLTTCHLSFTSKLSVIWDKTCGFVHSLRQERLALDPAAFWGAAGTRERITPSPLHSDTPPASRAFVYSPWEGA